VADVNVAILTFTRTEATAVRELLSLLYIDPTVWTPTLLGEEALEDLLSDGRRARVQHYPLSAQGNVVAAAELSRSTRENRADYYVFYGCCGAVDPKLVGQVFRAAWVSYMSLGVVVASSGGEVVKLKNKWIVRTHPNEQAPLEAIQLPAGSAGTPGSVSGLDLADAHVLATDKVIKISPGVAPVPIHATRRSHLRQGGLDVLAGACPVHRNGAYYARTHRHGDFRYRIHDARIGLE
jgi:hypothetical protein